MSVTIGDIARMAGVSLATVSRVVNHKSEGVGAETRQRIQALIAEHGYEPSAVARGLATGKSRTLGLVVPDIADPFFPLLIKGAEAALGGTGYGLLLCDSDQSFAKELDHLRLLGEKRIDGVILNTTDSTQDFQLEFLDRKGIPYVLLDRMVPSRSLSPGVYTDNRLGGALAAGFLLEGGVKNLLFLNGPRDLALSQLRLDGVTDAFEKHSRDDKKLTVAYGDYSVASGEELVHRLWLEAGRTWPFDALFAASDRMAVGAIRALKRQGIRVPQDVEVAGFDDIEMAGLVAPSLTTVAQPAREMGRLSVQLLKELAEGRNPEKKIWNLEPQLVVRESTKPRIRSIHGQF